MNLILKFRQIFFSQTKIKILISLVVMFFILNLTSCFKKQIQFSNELNGTLTIVGSSSTQEVCDALASEFMKIYSSVDVVKSGSGSAQAAIEVLNSNSQIGDLSRSLNPDEHPENFDVFPIAFDGIAICTNLKNPIKNLSSSQLKKIFTGEIKNWSEVGRKPGPIVVLGRDEASGTRTNFEKFIGALNECCYLIEQDSNGKIKEKIKNEENAIGYVAFSNIDESLNVMAVDGCKPTLQSIKNLNYKLRFPFLQITKKNSTDSLITEWLNFVFSEKGSKIIENFKLIPAKV